METENTKQFGYSLPNFVHEVNGEKVTTSVILIYYSPHPVTFTKAEAVQIFQAVHEDMADSQYQKISNYYPRLLTAVMNLQLQKEIVIQVKTQTLKGEQDPQQVVINFEDQQIVLIPGETKLINKVVKSKKK